MTHPKQDELMELMYGELPPDRRAGIEAHVSACGECRRQLAEWGGVRRELAAWALPDSTRTAVAIPGRVGATLRWAAAAVVVLASGYGLARMTTSAPAAVDVASLRSDLARELGDELRAEIAAEQTRLAAERARLAAEHTRLAADQSQRHDALQQAVAQALEEMETRRLASYASLRRDVETVALRTQAGFEQLASLEQPRSNSSQEQ